MSVLHMPCWYCTLDVSACSHTLCVGLFPTSCIRLVFTFDRVRLLLEAGADPNMNEGSAIKQVCVSGSLDMLTVGLEACWSNLR